MDVDQPTSSQPQRVKCAACDTELGQDTGYTVLLCLHVLCIPCLTAEQQDDAMTDLPGDNMRKCVASLSDELTCNVPYDLHNQLLTVQQQQQQQQQQQYGACSEHAVANAEFVCATCHRGMCAACEEAGHTHDNADGTTTAAIAGVPVERYQETSRQNLLAIATQLDARLPQLQRAVEGLKQAGATITQTRTNKTATRDWLDKFVKDIEQHLSRPQQVEMLLRGYPDEQFTKKPKGEVIGLVMKIANERRDKLLKEMGDSIVKMLSDQRDDLIVQLGHSEAAVASIRQIFQDHPLHQVPLSVLRELNIRATTLIETKPSAELCVKNYVDVNATTPVNVDKFSLMEPIDLITPTFTRQVLVHGLPHLVFSWQKRTYSHDITRRLSYGKRGSDLGRFDRPRGLTLNQDGNLFVADSLNCRIQTYTWDDHCNYAVYVNTPVFGVAATPNGDVWATLGEANEVRRIKGSSGAVVTRFPCTCPYGILSLPDGSVVVTCNDTTDDFAANSGRVEMYNADGSQRWVSKSRDGFSRATGLALIPELNQIVVCDLNRANDPNGSGSSLQILSLDTGDYVSEIKSATAPLNLPGAVAYDPVAKVLIVGEANRLSVWTLEGERLFDLPSELRESTGLVVSVARGEIITADCYNHRLVFY